MKEIKKEIASEELLKVYFFKLYQKRQIADIIFNEEQLDIILTSKSLNELTSNELFDCCSISIRTGDVDFSNYIPAEFFYFDECGLAAENIEEHPFLYTSISPLKNVPLYEASIGYWNLGSDIVDNNGQVLLTVSPNIYDDGYYDIISSSDNLIFVYYFDKNNADSCCLYSYEEKENKLISIKNFDKKDYVLNIINEHNYPIILSLVSEKLSKDKEVAIAAAEIDEYFLRFIDDSIKNDKDVLAAAMKNKL
jgi:hypothetical protein